MTAALTDAESSGSPVPGRSAFVVSDRTGMSADALAAALLARFPRIVFARTTIPFVGDDMAARDTVAQINRAAAEGRRPIVFLTVQDPALRSILQESQAPVVDLFAGHLHEVEAALATTASEPAGQPPRSNEDKRRADRLRAVDYAVEHDDGREVAGLDLAELILIGPSRCGKTETAMYLAIERGLLVANVPLTDDSARAGDGLPAAVSPHIPRCFGLTSTPLRLHQVRSERWPYSAYASLQQCSLELRRAEDLYRRRGIPYLNSAMKSVEETASAIIHSMKERTSTR